MCRVGASGRADRVGDPLGVELHGIPHVVNVAEHADGKHDSGYGVDRGVLRGRGCGTAYFELDTSKAEPAPTGPSTVVAAEAQLVTEAGECPGEVWSSRKAATCRGWKSVPGATTSR